MRTLRVGLEDRSYPIWIGHGNLATLPQALAACSFPRRLAILSNTVVAPLYLERVKVPLVQAGYQTDSFILPDGEDSKTLGNLESIYDFLIERGYDRATGLIALGGGVIGDMAGFAAATFLRGIPFVQVPTTLLAQVDSSVGGKTAVNHRLGKNLIGAFHQPRHVHIDVDTLSTLPPREFRAGLAEVVKYGMVCDHSFFFWLKERATQLLQRDAETLVEAIARACNIKADIVERDEKESSVRAVLNFGHTFGHAVETLCGYGTVLHGEAVAIGMVVAARIAREQGLCTSQELEELRALLARFELPVAPPELPFQAILDVMARDKKVRNGLLRMILNQGIGACRIVDVPEPEAILRSVLGEPGGSCREEQRDV